MTGFPTNGCDFIEVIPGNTKRCSGDIHAVCLDDNMELSLCNAHIEIMERECEVEVLDDDSWGTLEV